MNRAGYLADAPPFLYLTNELTEGKGKGRTNNMIARATAEATVDRQTAMDFILGLQSKLCGVPGFIELRSFPDKERGTGHNYFMPTIASVAEIGTVLNWAETESRHGRGVFVAYNPRS